MVLLPWGEAVAPVNEEERVLLSPLIDFLIRTRRVRPDTIVRIELPWAGRRVDVATLTSSLSASAYELKLASISRAIEQAAYNRLSFDRSWVVTASTPGPGALSEAESLGIGIMQLRSSGLRVISHAQWQGRQNRVVRARLLRQMRGRAEEHRVS